MVGLQPARQLAGVSPEPDDEAEFTHPAAVRLAQERPHRPWRRSPSGNFSVSSARVRSSQSRKTGSPESAKIALMDRACADFDLEIGVYERPVQPASQNPPNGRFSGPTIADQRQSLFGCGWRRGIVCHFWRSGVSLSVRVSCIKSIGGSCPV